MDSKLLNGFQDDPFDDNLWSNNNENVGLQQLTDTFQSILPIPITGVTEYTSSIGLTDDFRLEQKDNSSLIYNENELMFNNIMPEGNDIEIVTIDPDDNMYNRDSENDDEYNDNDTVTYDINANYTNDINTDLLDIQSNYSGATFRSRTDSSSIADYESHTSDYDEDDNTYRIDEDKKNSFEVTNALHFESGLLTPDELLLDSELKMPMNELDLHNCHKRRTFSTNTIASDIDGLVAIDGSTFDLADFLTKDDFLSNVTTDTTKLSKKAIDKACKTATQTNGSLNFLSRRKFDSESESDVIVDIETIEAPIKNNDDVPYVDNVKNDPSWIPKQKENNIHTTNIQLSTKAISVVKHNVTRPLANEKHYDFLRSKSNESNSEEKIQLEHNNEKQTAETLPNSYITKTKTELEKLIATEFNVALPETLPIKRKLNLEEYKKRRGGINGVVSQCATSYMPKLFPAIEVQESKKTKSISSMVNVGQTQIKKHSEAVVSIVKTLKEQQVSNCKIIGTDPITEARNKVLRMQELKRAQQLKIIDSAISAKVPRVTKLLPLKDIIKDGAYSDLIHKETINHTSNTNAALCPDYEEIIIVSASCNTDISIPPLNVLSDQHSNATSMQRVNKASRSLLKSSVLLQKVQATENMKLSNNSLIASIQNVVVQAQKQSKNTLLCIGNANNFKQEKKCKCEQQSPQSHGEDKIIMHLRKDRIRKNTSTVAIQTDFLPEFPIFPAPLRRKQYRKRLRTKSSTTSSFSSLSVSSDSEEQSNYSPPAENCLSFNSRVRCLANGVSGTCTTVGSFDTAGGYSSRSSRRHRSSISSSYSESDRILRQRRQRRSSCKHHVQKEIRSSSTSSISSHSDNSHHSRSRTRSRSPTYDDVHSTSHKKLRLNHEVYNNNNKNYSDRNVSQPAVEERRIVYVGRIEQETTKEILKRKFQIYGPISQITIHTKETGMKYGFVTFLRSQDAFAAIDSSGRNSQINMYDISFGGRRAFCRASYADLDNAGINTYHSFVFPKTVPPSNEDDSFEALLLKVKAKLNSTKSSPVIPVTAARTPITNAECIEISNKT